MNGSSCKILELCKHRKTALGKKVLDSQLGASMVKSVKL